LQQLEEREQSGGRTRDPPDSSTPADENCPQRAVRSLSGNRPKEQWT
jgi:hypothetical protein